MWVRTWVVVRVPSSLEMAWMSAPWLHKGEGWVSTASVSRRPGCPASTHAQGAGR